MRELEAPDRHHLNAAQGWLELGNPTEAAAELDRLTAAGQAHPGALEVRWRVVAEARNWEQALEIARALIEADPDSPAGWINQSYALHELHRTQEAWDRLRPLADRFSKVGTIPYNLACYACQLGNINLAREWLAKAIEGRGRAEVLALARADHDLQPLWDQLDSL